MMKQKQLANNSQAIYVLPYLLLIQIFGMQGEHGKLNEAVIAFNCIRNGMFMKRRIKVYIFGKWLTHSQWT